MKRIATSLTLVCCFLLARSQSKNAENILIVTLDGMRWQEVFGGADSALSNDTAANYSTSYIKKNFWAATDEERKRKLMPFLWDVVAAKGVMLGSRKYGNHFETANPYFFSYPGYNEIFTGYPDTAVNSNDKIPNKNENVLEFLNKQQGFKGKVASFGSWDVFTSILNAKRSGIMVNDGFLEVKGNVSERLKLYNSLQHEMPDLFHGGERLDVMTFNMGFEYMKSNKPRVMHFGFGDTDEFAHAGMYDLYLDAAQKADAWIKRLWDYIQSDPFYANKTTLIIATDHGRGEARDGRWRHHGQETPESQQLWMAAIGPSVGAAGEVKTQAMANQGQIAATIAQLLGKSFKTDHPVLPALNLSKP
jgi:hypothetical protein